MIDNVSYVSKHNIIINKESECHKVMTNIVRKIRIVFITWIPKFPKLKYKIHKSGIIRIKKNSKKSHASMYYLFIVDEREICDGTESKGK